jgi:hypothetical protein
MDKKGSGNFERLERWRQSGGSVEKAELHAHLMAALIAKKDKLSTRQLRRLCKLLVSSPYEGAVALLAGVSETVTTEDLRAALNLIERSGQKRPRP